MSRFVWSWNYHRIRGPCKGIPIEMTKNSKITPVKEEYLPSIEHLVNEYNMNGGKIKADLSDVQPFKCDEQNRLMLSYIDSIDFDNVYDKIVNNDKNILLDLI